MSVKCPKCKVEMSIDPSCVFVDSEGNPAESAWYCFKCDVHMMASKV